MRVSLIHQLITEILSLQKYNVLLSYLLKGVIIETKKRQINRTLRSKQSPCFKFWISSHVNVLLSFDEYETSIYDTHCLIFNLPNQLFEQINIMKTNVNIKVSLRKYNSITEPRFDSCVQLPGIVLGS